MTTEHANETHQDGAGQTKTMPPKRLRQTLYWLALDWIHLTTQLPTPPRNQQTRTSNTKEYGHPAEWASDKAREIVDKLTSWHDLLAEHRNERPPTTGIAYGNNHYRQHRQTTQSDQLRLTAAWKYLEPRCEQLTQLVDAEDLKELPDLHHGIRRTLGATTPRYTLPVPCPNNDCQLRTLTRIQGVGQDFIACDACGYMIKEQHYPFLVRMTLEAVLNGTA